MKKWLLPTAALALLAAAWLVLRKERQRRCRSRAPQRERLVSTLVTQRQDRTVRMGQSRRRPRRHRAPRGLSNAAAPSRRTRCWLNSTRPQPPRNWQRPKRVSPRRKSRSRPSIAAGGRPILPTSKDNLYGPAGAAAKRKGVLVTRSTVGKERRHSAGSARGARRNRQSRRAGPSARSAAGGACHASRPQDCQGASTRRARGRRTGAQNARPERDPRAHGGCSVQVGDPARSLPEHRRRGRRGRPDRPAACRRLCGRARTGAGSRAYACHRHLGRLGRARVEGAGREVPAAVAALGTREVGEVMCEIDNPGAACRRAPM